MNLWNELDWLKEEPNQQKLGEQAQAQLFEDDDAKRNTVQTIGDFVEDYLQNGRNQPIDRWLIGRFSQYADIWQDEQEKIDTAHTIIDTIEQLTRNQLAVDAHCLKRKTLENFYQTKLGEVAKTYQLDAQELAQQIDQSLAQSNVAQLEPLMGEPISPIFDNARLNQQTLRRLKLNANLNLAKWGVKMAGARLANAFLGKKNLSTQQELQRILRLAVDSAENKGVQIATSGGVVVSAKKGWIKNALAGLEKVESVVGKAGAMLSRVQDLTLNIANGWNDLRLFDQVERGALAAVDVAAEKAKFATAQAITALEQKAKVFCRTKGAAWGSKLGMWVGSVFSPAGTVIGGTVGGVMGEVAGDWVADKVVTPVAETVKSVAHKSIDVVKDTVSTVVSKGKEILEDAWEGVKSVGHAISESKLNPFNWF